MNPTTPERELIQVVVMRLKSSSAEGTPGKLLKFNIPAHNSVYPSNSLYRPPALRSRYPSPPRGSCCLGNPAVALSHPQDNGKWNLALSRARLIRSNRVRAGRRRRAALSSLA
ncbi:hypothetical protein J6590_005230 [Homalodisca vitripennis]|nr:hypothetical protein J6590_005230 [Homalodisca vitripennis]